MDILIPLCEGFKTMRISRNLMGWDVKSILKRFPKYVINSKISKHFDTSNYFGSYDDFCRYWDKKSKVEVEVHPVFKDGVLLDLCGKSPQDLSKYKF